MRNSPVLSWIATAAVVSGIACLAALHVVLGCTVDPLREPVSVYTVFPSGRPLFAAAGIGFATACAALAVRVRERVPRWLFAGAAAAFVVLILFRTDAGKTVSSASGYVHRYSAAVAFVLLTILGWMAARANRGRVRWWIGVLTGVSTALLVFNALDILLPWGADGALWRGLRQRVMLVLHCAMIITMATAAIGWRRGASDAVVTATGSVANTRRSGGIAAEDPHDLAEAGAPPRCVGHLPAGRDPAVTPMAESGCRAPTDGRGCPASHE